MDTLAEIEAAVPRLNPEELEHLEGWLRELRQTRAATHEPIGTDLQEFAGALKLTRDPLEWQRQERGEWE